MIVDTLIGQVKFSGQVSIDRGFTRLWRACPPCFWRAYPPLLWRAVLGKSGCCEEKCTPIIIRDADKALHLVFPGTLTDLT